MAINIQIFKNGKPVEDVKISYEKTSFLGGGNSGYTNSAGLFTSQADHGEAFVKIYGKGIDHSGIYYLNNHFELHFWFFLKIFKTLIFLGFLFLKYFFKILIFLKNYVKI